MYSRIKLLDHPVHPMLVAFPIAFYTATLAAFIVYGLGADAFWFRLGIVANAAGVVMAIAAAVPGFLDWYEGIPAGTAPKRHGFLHMSLNVAALILFAVNLGLNGGQWNVVPPVPTYSILLPLFGFLCTLGAGYLGWTLVQTDHVGIQLSPGEERCLERTLTEESDLDKRRAA